jgi:hypothetical protein
MQLFADHTEPTMGQRKLPATVQRYVLHLGTTNGQSDGTESADVGRQDLRQFGSMLHAG